MALAKAKEAWNTKRRDAAREEEPPEKLLPQNLEAEVGTLGGILIDRAALELTLRHVRAEHFYREAHREIFAAICALHRAGVPADLITISDELERCGKLEACGGISYVASLANQVPTSANVEHYARIV